MDKETAANEAATKLASEVRSSKTEKQCAFNRLSVYDNEPPAAAQQREPLGYEKIRQKIAEDVRAPLRHRTRLLCSLRPRTHACGQVAHARPSASPSAQVARSRVYNSRMTGDTTTEGMLPDLGPGLCSSFIPGGYAPVGFSTANRETHIYHKVRTRGCGSSRAACEWPMASQGGGRGRCRVPDPLGCLRRSDAAKLPRGHSPRAGASVSTRSTSTRSTRCPRSRRRRSDWGRNRSKAVA